MVQKLLEAALGVAIVVVPLFFFVELIDKHWHEAQSGGK